MARQEKMEKVRQLLADMGFSPVFTQVELMSDDQLNHYLKQSR